jgi:surface antigen
MIRRALVALVLAGLLAPSAAGAASDHPHQHWFAYGQCTWLAYKKRPDIVDYGAKNNGFYHWDGWEWSGHARAEGYAVNRKPHKGDIAVWQPRVAGAGSKGHLAYVRALYSNGRVGVVEMNFNGIKDAHRRTLPKSQAKKLEFIHHGPGG